MRTQTKRELLIEALIEQELSTQMFEALIPNIPLEATPLEALRFAREQLQLEYSVIAIEDLVTLYKIFISDDMDDVLLAQSSAVAS